MTDELSSDEPFKAAIYLLPKSYSLGIDISRQEKLLWIRMKYRLLKTSRFASDNREWYQCERQTLSIITQ